MEIQISEHANLSVASLANNQILKDERDATDLVANAVYQNCSHVLLTQDQLSDDFFQLSTQLAGAMLQKFTNYRAKLAIVGDFEHVQSDALSAFIIECNRSGDILFVASAQQALTIWQA